MVALLATSPSDETFRQARGKYTSIDVPSGPRLVIRTSPPDCLATPSIARFDRQCAASGHRVSCVYGEVEQDELEGPQSDATLRRFSAEP
jgi:hypothetical protein